MTHDESSKELHSFFDERWQGGVSHLNLIKGRRKYDPTMFYSCEIQEKLKPLKEIEGKPLTVYGHGSYHHYTYGIVGNTMPQRTNEFLYIHIDYHTDAGVCKQQCNCGTAHNIHGKCGMSVGCGSFVMELVDHGAKNFLFVGTDAKCGWKRKQWVRQEQLLQSDYVSLLTRELKRKRCQDVYISMDLDVLTHAEIPTGYGRGKITLRHLLDILTTIKEHKNILGADILGLCRRDTGSHRNVPHKKACYYQPTGYLTYGIIASHLAGRDYLDAMKVRDYVMGLDSLGQNGVTFNDIAEGLVL
jgi:hypothetical protein